MFTWALKYQGIVKYFIFGAQHLTEASKNVNNLWNKLKKDIHIADAKLDHGTVMVGGVCHLPPRDGVSVICIKQNEC